MGLNEILTQVDREIQQLKQARAVLEGSRTSAFARAPKKRKLTLEGRRRIAEAVKRRWARERGSLKPTQVA